MENNFFFGLRAKRQPRLNNNVFYGFHQLLREENNQVNPFISSQPAPGHFEYESSDEFKQSDLYLHGGLLTRRP